jgi:hypothetical protein
VFHSQLAAITIQALLVAFFFGFESYRRGLPEDWMAYGLGFVGLLDFPLLMWFFGNNPPEWLGMPPIAHAIIVPLVLFIGVYILNTFLQGRGERQELLRDRLSDSMLFFSAMKLVAVLTYIFMFLL